MASAKKTSKARKTTKKKVETTVRGRPEPTDTKRAAKKTSDKPKRNTTDTASKGQGTKPILKGSDRREIIPTMPSVIVGKQPTGKQLKGEENMPGVAASDEEEDRVRPLSEKTIDRLGRAELRAIGVSRGYWASRDSENRSGTRMTKAAFLEAQKADKRLKGSEI